MNEDVLNQILSELQEIKESIRDLKSGHVLISEQLHSIQQAVLETTDTVKRIEAKQDEQQKVIEQLAYKSVEHDAEIKRIK